MQVVLTGHAQVSDPRWAPRSWAQDEPEHGTPARRASPLAGVAWLKPTWLEADNEPHTYGRELNRQLFVRPLNAPLDAGAWKRLQAARAAAGFSWAFLPQSAVASTAPTIAKLWEARPRTGKAHDQGGHTTPDLTPLLSLCRWETMLGRGLGSMRVDGTRNGALLAVLVTCQTRGWIAQDDHRGSFLFRPEPEAVTWAKFVKDFPDESAAIVARKSGGGGSGGRSRGGRKKRERSGARNEAKRQSRWKKALRDTE